MSNFNWVKGGSSDGRMGYILTFDYNYDLIQKLKETIPSYLREWNGDKKYWWIDERCERFINILFPGFLEAVVSQRRLF